jgi:hypothetical protein
VLLWSHPAPVHLGMTASAKQVTHGLLDNRQYHIEFHGFLTNHVKHAVVGLHGLEASAERIKHYWNECAPRIHIVCHPSCICLCFPMRRVNLQMHINDACCS